MFSTDLELGESQDTSLLQRRARRRLVGAIALVVFIVIALPIVLDKEPSPIGQDLVVQIPSQDAGRINTRALTSPVPGAVVTPLDAGEPGKSAPVKPEPAPIAPAVSPAKIQPPAAEGKAAPTQSDAAQAGKGEVEGTRAQALLEAKEAWVVPLGSFSSEKNVKQLQAKLATAKIKSHTETVKGANGEQTRVRAGPFESKSAAEKTSEKLRKMGLRPGAVTAQ
jgi:DedD protein